MVVLSILFFITPKAFYLDMKRIAIPLTNIASQPSIFKSLASMGTPTVSRLKNKKLSFEFENEHLNYLSLLVPSTTDYLKIINILHSVIQIFRRLNQPFIKKISVSTETSQEFTGLINCHIHEKGFFHTD